MRSPVASRERARERAQWARRSGGLPRLVVLAAAVALSACSAAPSGPSGTPSGASSATSSSSSPAVTGEVTVLAAASLTKSFTDLARSFEAAHPGVHVRLSFGSSSTLAQQIAQGAPADLFAAAGTKALTQLGDSAPAGSPVTIAENTLEIAVAPGNPKGVTGLASLADPALAVVLCAATVPCGTAADQILTKSSITAHVVSREIDVKATLAKVTLGEADAAIVYHSDVVSAGQSVVGVVIPQAQNIVLTYPLVTLNDSRAAGEFAAYITGPQGRKALQANGFRAP